MRKGQSDIRANLSVSISVISFSSSTQVKQNNAFFSSSLIMKSVLKYLCFGAWSTFGFHFQNAAGSYFVAERFCRLSVP